MTLLDSRFFPEGWASEGGYHDEQISDDELTVLALAADPEPELGPDAIPFTPYRNQPSASLPLWYMPPVTARAAGGWRLPVVASVVLALLLINALGLCITYGVARRRLSQAAGTLGRPAHIDAASGCSHPRGSPGPAGDGATDQFGRGAEFSSGG